MGREPMMSWTEGFLTDCEDDLTIDNALTDPAYKPGEVVRAVRWLYDRCQQLEDERDALASVVRHYQDGWTQDEHGNWCSPPGYVIGTATAPVTPAEVDAIRRALGDVGEEGTA